VQVDRQDRWRGTGDATGDFFQDDIEGVGGSAYGDKLYDMAARTSSMAMAATISSGAGRQRLPGGRRRR
jgi:hypothetical protein